MWILVAVYYSVAVETIAAAIASRDVRERLPWAGIAATLMACAAAKQFGLMGLFSEWLRTAAQEHRVYQWRALAQYPFTLAIFVAVILFYVSTKNWARATKTSIVAAMTATVTLIALILVRVPSIHFIDSTMTKNVAGLRVGWWIELICLGIIAIAGGAYLKTWGASPGGT